MRRTLLAIAGFGAVFGVADQPSLRAQQPATAPQPDTRATSRPRPQPPPTPTPTPTPAPAPAPAPASLDALGIAAAAVAKITASAVFLQNRAVQSVLDVEFAPTDVHGRMIHPLAKVTVDRAARTVTASILSVERTAVYRDGLGCALVLGGVLPGGGLDSSALPAEPPPAEPWPTGDVDASLPRPTGLDESALTAAVDDAFVGHAPPRNPQTRAVLVVYRGKIVAERYGEGFGPDTPLHGWSMTKSLTDALVGLRVGEHRLDVHAPADFAPWVDAGDRHALLTMEQLLRMSSGLEWEEDYISITSDPIRMLFAEPDVAAFAGARPIEDKPGTVWEYSSGTTNLLCKILRDSFDSDAEYHAYPRRALFDPIGMRTAVLETDSTGTFVGSSLGYASARDWARFGLLYLHDGIWQGQRVLPPGWVRASTTPTAAAPRARYGRHWWLNHGDLADRSNRPYPKVPTDAFYASGHEGQLLAIIPSLRTVVVRLGCTKIRQTFRDRRFLQAIVAALPTE